MIVALLEGTTVEPGNMGGQRCVREALQYAAPASEVWMLPLPGSA